MECSRRVGCYGQFWGSCIPFFFSLFIYFERERESASRGGAERERETQAGSKLSVHEPDVGLDLMNHEIMT